MPDILSRSGPLLARHARDGEPIYPGHIYIARPDYHLVLNNSSVHLTHGARENFMRPAIDPLFRSAARGYGPRVIGVILTGSLHDGVAGLLAIRAAGGLAVIQDPADAHSAMLPQAAYNLAGSDYVVRGDDLAALLVKLVSQPVAPSRGTPMTDPMDNMNQEVDNDVAEQVKGQRNGQLSALTCPECGGALWQVNQDQVVRFRCHVGHAFYAEALLDHQSEVLEAALWTAVRSFKEKEFLARQLAARAHAEGKAESAHRFHDQAHIAHKYSTLIQQYLLQGLPQQHPADVATPSEPETPA